MPPLSVVLLLLLPIFTLQFVSCDIVKANRVKIAAIGPWKIDPTANFMGQFNFLNFTAFCLNNQTDILPDVAIDLVFADTGTVPGTAIMVSVDVVNQGIIGLLGGARTPQQQIVSYLANAFQIVHMGGIVTGAILSDKISYPYFMRTSLADQFICTVMMKYILKTGWTNVVLIHQDDAYGTGNRQAFLQLAGANNVTVYTLQVSTGQREFSTQLDLIYQTGIHVLVVLCQINEATALLASMKTDGRLVNKDYVYLIGQVYFLGWYQSKTLNATVFDGSIVFAPAIDTGPLPMDLWHRYQQSDPATFPGNRVTFPSTTYWSLSEGLYSFAYGLQEYLNRYPSTNLSKGVNGSIYYSILRNLSYTGVSGRVKFDSNGDRLAICNIYTVRQPDLGTNTFNANVSIAMVYSPFDESFTQVSPIMFYGSRKDTPRDIACPCVFGTCVGSTSKCNCDTDYSGDTCSVYTGKSSTSLIIAIVIPVIFAIGGLFGAFAYYRRKNARIVKEIAEKQRSDIPRSAIKLGTRIGRGASGEVFTALFRGTEVAVKRLSAKNLSASALQQFQLETAIMTGLRHPNIILFMGSCYDKTTEEFLLIMELCSRGSLYDALYNKNINLNLDLQMHMVSQILQGINFLHQSSPPIIHCDIKSHNVLLDEKWNCRICDFGITIFSSANQKKAGEEALGTVYWSAPEVLSGGSHTVASDCYSIGILLWEIFHRRLPFDGRDPLSVAFEVVNNGTRPLLDPKLPHQMSELIVACWNQDPTKRPTVQDMVDSLREMSKPMYAATPEDYQIIAPTGSVTFVVTDIIDSALLWDAVPKQMLEVMKRQNNLMRSLIDTYKGYEVSCTGHSFLVAFSRVFDAVNWCAAIQNALLAITWPPAILALPSTSRKMGSYGQLLWNGLRIKMAIHRGTPQCTHDKLSQKMQYEGPVVRKMKTLLDHSRGGMVLMSEAAFEALDHAKLDGEVSTQRQYDGDEANVIIVPRGLDERLRGYQASNDGDSPYSVIEMSEPFAEAKQQKEKWALQWEDIALKEHIGMGSGAEIHSATHKGVEVAVKLLINQNFSEDNNFTLRYVASVLSKLDHPNLLRYIGLVLEAPHICLVSDLMSMSLSKFYQSNASFPFQEKIRIAKSIANGMKYLCERDDPTLGQNVRLNSNNILLSKNGEIKISDFATNKLYDSNRTLTSVNAVAWTAPELLNSDDVVTSSVAVYSFGIVLWEMMTRKKPYLSIHPIRLLNMVAKGHRPEIPNECPPAFSSLMMECWDGDPTERPSWEQILRKLDAM